jgi:hypothetical protein
MICDKYRGKNTGPQSVNLRVINKHPCFITCYDIGDKVAAMSGLMSKFPANRNVIGLVVVIQQS